MKIAIPILWAMSCVVLAASLAPAQYPAYSPVTHQPLGFAPDACGPGYYFYDCYGTLYGPTYCVYPPFPPFNGCRGPMPSPTPVVGRDGKPHIPASAYPPMPPKALPTPIPPTFLTHPYARSPRDYFMWTEAQQDRFTREQMPRYVP